ncbi:amidohydrolase [Hyphomicrobium nitrativorans NL23]|uniref:Amidohydrolase n=1 Tax=Hyphomicrobium nitrativorans NL23 TaxID=1029756 RepID=V5S9F3_9HYPH|nr:amidohydrolase [Hyphomicrobium nitrativorans]AHB47366.1 amidohydrolase [Hyphomicrobium nitrativorans NL23]
MPIRRRTFVQGLASAGALATIRSPSARGQQMTDAPDVILHNGRITTLDAATPDAEAVAVKDGLVETIGTDDTVMRLAGPKTKIVDLGGRRTIPGLNDSHTHLIRGGLNFNMELRWEGVPSVADALRSLKAQAERTPAPQWVRVVGGWSEFQFAERRMPTLDDINNAAPDTPVFILHLYGRALLNKAALNVLGFDKSTPNPPGGVIEKDASGNPTGLLLAKPSALILYSTLARGPTLPIEDQINSTRHYMREMNRLGITSVIDAGGGGQNYPDDYDVIQRLHDAGELTVRIAYNLFAQKAGGELGDFERWSTMAKPDQGTAMLRMSGAGENLTWSAADFENFLEPRPDLAPTMEADLEPIVELLAANKWPFRIHATYDESIDRFLTVFERVNGKSPFETRFIIDHAETISDRNIDRIKALGGGIAIQHRMAFQGEYFVERYGADAARETPPINKMLAAGLPVGAGTDATRVSSYDPWVALFWLTTGQTLGGLPLYGEANILDRTAALRLWTAGSAWFSGEAEVKGTLSPGKYADLAVLSADYMTVPPQEIRRINAVLTMVGGAVVYGEGDYADLSPPIPPASPSWSPVNTVPSPAQRAGAEKETRHARACADGCQSHCGVHGHDHLIAWNNPIPVSDKNAFWGALGCSCFAV